MELTNSGMLLFNETVSKQNL